MRIFVLHNHYQDKGGEDIVFAQEVDELRQRHQVQTMTFTNKKGWRGLLQFLFYPWNIFATKKTIQQIAAFRPDIVHVHNIHYAVGPLLFRALYKRGIPVVFTLHNFRLLDPSASLFYKGNVYMPDLKADFPWESVRLKVLDNSLLKTFWTAFAYYLHKKTGTWRHVDKYLTFSHFAKECLVNSSLRIKPAQIAIKPNFVQPLASSEATDRKDYFVYIGRLSIEKGVLPLLRAFSRSDIQIKIFGDGPLREEVVRTASQHPNIEYEGFQDKTVLNKHLRTCQALIVPSICYEGMPLSLLEAFSAGTPVLASRIGILEEMIKEGIHGLHFEANDPDSMIHTLDKWKTLPKDHKQIISINCQKAYLEKYSPEKNVILLEEIYKETLQNRKDYE